MCHGERKNCAVMGGMVDYDRLELGALSNIGEAAEEVSLDAAWMFTNRTHCAGLH